MDFVYKREFLKAFDSLNEEDKALTIQADGEIRRYHETSEASWGLRIKKLRAAGHVQVYEARIKASLRIVWVKEKNLVSFVILGNHETVRKYLKNL